MDKNTAKFGESRSHEFQFYGTNEELKFVDEEMLRKGEGLGQRVGRR